MLLVVGTFLIDPPTCHRGYLVFSEAFDTNQLLALVVTPKCNDSISYA